MERHPPASGPGVVPLDAARGMDPALIGAKAAGLVQLMGLGLRVPPGFVVTTEVCGWVRDHGGLPADAAGAIGAAIGGIEAATGRTLGGADPLLLAVRSGGPTSMPGMMDTVLDVGFGPRTRAALAGRAGEGFARSCHARFLAGYGATVVGATLPATSDPDELLALLGAAVPADPQAQVLAAVEAVVRSWDNDRARAYRLRHGIDDAEGTAVVVQAMVFGDLPGRSGAGVASSRDPSTGRPGLCGDLLLGAQGTDVVAGTHDPVPIAELARLWPDVDLELRSAVAAVEAAARDVVDVEFTVEDGTLHLLQSRIGLRAAPAAVRIAVDLVDEGAITVTEALARVSPTQVAHASRWTAPADGPTVVARGIGASPGVATGEVCLSAGHVATHGGPVVLVRGETSPDDIRGMVESAGVLTAHGGLVSHAALVARELDLPAVVGVEALRPDEVAGTVAVGDLVLSHGDVVTIDGSTGCVHLGAVPLVEPAPDHHLARFRAWQAAHHPT